jgi:SAM-dependent methyltransferase
MKVFAFRNGYTLQRFNIMLDYNQLAADYARNRRVNPNVLKALIDLLGAVQGSMILEVGCGTGNYITAFAEAPDGMAYGLEPSTGMLEHARSRGSRVRLLAGRAEAIGLAAAIFDLVFSVDVIHHVEDITAYLGEAYRILKPGGWLCTVTDSEAIIRARKPLSTYFPETIVPEMKRYPRIEDLKTGMTQAGFDDLREQNVSFDYRLTDLQIYRERAFSALHLISDDAWQAGLSRMEFDLARDGSIPGVSMYVLLWGRKPAP